MCSAPGAPCWRRRPVKLQSPLPSHREQSQAIFAMVGQAFLTTEMPAVTAETMATCSVTVASEADPRQFLVRHLGISRHDRRRAGSGSCRISTIRRSLQSSLCDKCSLFNAGASSRSILWRLTDRHLRSKSVMAWTLAGDGEALPWLSGEMTASFSRQVEYIASPCRGRIASASGGVHRTSSCSDPQYEPV